MPRGPGPPFGQEIGEIIPVADLGEVVARLTQGRGALHRGGKVLFTTTFANGKVEVPYSLADGTGADIVADNTLSEVGPGCLKLIHGSTIGDVTYIERGYPGCWATFIGHEVSVLCNLGAGQFRVQVYVCWPDGVHSTWEIQFTWQTSPTKQTLIEYLDSAQAWQTLATLGAFETQAYWANVKLIVDNRIKGSPKYARLLLNGVNHDMEGIAAYSDTYPDAYLPKTRYKFTWESLVASNEPIYLGSWTFTIDEQ